MVGIEFVENQETKKPNKTIVPAMVQDCVQRGLMIEPAGRWNQVIRFLAPLVITEEQLEWGLDAMRPHPGLHGQVNRSSSPYRSQIKHGAGCFSASAPNQFLRLPNQPGKGDSKEVR